MTKLMALGFALLASTAYAETVPVKHMGEVSLVGFECPNLAPSSFVNRICYDADKSYVVVQLKETYYHYCGVPQRAVNLWVNAPSLGRHYNQHFRAGPFDCRVHGAPE